MECTPEQQAQNDITATLIETGSSAVGLVIAVAGGGLTSPISMGIGAAGHIAAEGIRDQCRYNSEIGQATLTTAGGIAVNTAAGALIPGGGALSNLGVAGVNIVYGMATGQIENPYKPAVAGDASNIQPTSGMPTPLFPEPVMQQAMAARPQGHTVVSSHTSAGGHGLTASQQQSQALLSGGLY